MKHHTHENQKWTLRWRKYGSATVHRTVQYHSASFSIRHPNPSPVVRHSSFLNNGEKNASRIFAHPTCNSHNSHARKGLLPSLFERTYQMSLYKYEYDEDTIETGDIGSPQMETGQSTQPQSTGHSATLLLRRLWKRLSSSWKLLHSPRGNTIGLQIA